MVDADLWQEEAEHLVSFDFSSISTNGTGVEVFGSGDGNLIFSQRLEELSTKLA